MKNIKNHINADFLLMFMMSMMNMLFLHQYFLQTIALEIPCYFSSFFDNLLACLIDVTFVLLVSWIITFRRVRASLAITFVITLLWSFCNAFYARFFHQYLSWSSIGLAGNLADPIVFDIMTAGFRLIDLYYPLVIILFCWIYFRSKRHDVKSRSLQSFFYTWLCCLSLCLVTHFLYAFHPHCSVVYELETPKVAQIGDVRYETLEAAVAAAASGDTITLLDDSAGNGIKINYYPSSPSCRAAPYCGEDRATIKRD